MLDGRREWIEQRALAIQREIEARSGPFYAEVVDCVPLWHVIETVPGQEGKAVRFLVERHFGVFLPTFDDDVDARLSGGRRLIFPGHVFLFVWDIARHWQRITVCPGVLRVLMDRVEHPVVVPDRVIDKIQALQFGFAEQKMSRRKRARMRRLGLQDQSDTITLTCPSHWHKIETLASSQRISLLHRALGLETRTPVGADATVPS